MVSDEDLCYNFSNLYILSHQVFFWNNEITTEDKKSILRCFVNTLTTSVYLTQLFIYRDKFAQRELKELKYARSNFDMSNLQNFSYNEFVFLLFENLEKQNLSKVSLSKLETKDQKANFQSYVIDPIYNNAYQDAKNSEYSIELQISQSTKNIRRTRKFDVYINVQLVAITLEKFFKTSFSRELKEICLTTSSRKNNFSTIDNDTLHIEIEDPVNSSLCNNPNRYFTISKQKYILLMLAVIAVALLSVSLYTLFILSLIDILAVPSLCSFFLFLGGTAMGLVSVGIFLPTQRNILQDDSEQQKYVIDSDAFNIGFVLEDKLRTELDIFDENTKSSEFIRTL